MENPVRSFRKKVTLSIVLLMSGLFVCSLVFAPRIFAQQTGAEAVSAAMTPEQASVARFALLAAAAAFGLGAIGAGVAIFGVGAAAMGAIAEKPEIAGQALIFVALAEGLVVFGFITALMILGKV